MLGIETPQQIQERHALEQSLNNALLNQNHIQSQANQQEQERFTAFAHRQNCEYITLPNGTIMFANGAQWRTNGGTVDAPTHTEYKLAARRTYLNCQLREWIPQYNDQHSWTVMALTHQKMGKGPGPGSGWQEGLTKFAELITAAKREIAAIEAELQHGAAQTAASQPTYQERGRQQASADLAALSSLPVFASARATPFRM